MARRWAVQKCRRVFHSALYLSDRGGYSELARCLPGGNDLAATRAVIGALTSGNANGLPSYPGPALSDFAQLGNESCSRPPSRAWPPNPSTRSATRS
jgi:hypothetical protein